jgi:hypothetical protein
MAAGTLDDHLRPTNPYSPAQQQKALELRQCRLNGTQHGDYGIDNGAASHSLTRKPDYRASRGRAPDGTASSTPTDPAPGVPDAGFFWYNTMKDMQ